MRKMAATLSTLCKRQAEEIFGDLKTSLGMDVFRTKAPYMSFPD